MDYKKPSRRPGRETGRSHDEPHITVTFDKKKLIWIGAIAAAALIVLLVVVPNVQKMGGNEPKPQATVLDFTPEEMDASGIDLLGQVIIVDAGHGGEDHGSTVAPGGTPEKELNLAVAKKLQKNLEQAGATVIMTRTTDDALGATKEDDFVAREEIIKQADADMFISVHMNEYEEKDASGPQVFFLKQGAVGKRLATAIQDMLNYTMQFEYPRMPIPADYRVLRTGAQPSCTVECGFLSNPEEGALLETDEYQQEIADCIADGVKLYLKRYAEILEQEAAEKEAAAQAAASATPAASAAASAGSATETPQPPEELPGVDDDANVSLPDGGA